MDRREFIATGAAAAGAPLVGAGAEDPSRFDIKTEKASGPSLESPMFVKLSENCFMLDDVPSPLNGPYLRQYQDQLVRLGDEVEKRAKKPRLPIKEWVQDKTHTACQCSFEWQITQIASGILAEWDPFNIPVPRYPRYGPVNSPGRRRTWTNTADSVLQQFEWLGPSAISPLVVMPYMEIKRMRCGLVMTWFSRTSRKSGETH